MSNVWDEPLTKPVEELSTYLAVLPDFKEGSKRMSVRPTHLEHAKAGHQRGWIVSAGATFEGEQSGGKMTGSWFLIKEESLDAARARLSKDIYSTGGAWDMDAATVTAVAIAKH